MLLAREKKILVLLYNNKRKFTTNELAGALKVSPRTIKNDIKCIIQELEENKTGCNINTKTGQGTWITYDENGKRYMDNLLANGSEFSFVLPEIRKYYVALKLLDADDYISMESIADSIYVSRSVIVSCINELTSVFEHMGVTLEKKVKHGMRVVGEEEQLRIATAYVIRKMVSNNENYSTSNLQPLFKEINLKKINDIIQNAEKNLEFILADNSYAELVIQLAIVVKRIQNGKFCTAHEEQFNENNAKKEWNIANYLSDELEEKFMIKLSEGDRAYLMMNLLGINTQYKVPVTENDLESIEKIDSNNLEIMEEILKQTDDFYHENFENDNMLKCNLFMHLNALLNRLSHQIRLENCMRRTVKEQLVYEVEVASYMARLISEKFKMSLGENEICDIAMYIGASLERERAQRNTCNPRVVLVCASGIGSSQFIRARLVHIFPNITITKILPITLAKTEIKPGGQDFVISTVPLPLKGIDVIYVSPMLGESDAITIYERMNLAKTGMIKESRKRYPHLFSLINEKISIFKCDCKSMEEVIGLMGNRLFHEKYVDEGFTASAFKREQLSSTSVGDYFAIPHAFEGHILKSGIGLMTLKKPIMWGNEKVQIIFMLSLDARSQNLFKSVFTELTEITKDTEAISKILSADKFDNIQLE